jgi:hypothetical protein
MSPRGLTELTSLTVALVATARSSGETHTPNQARAHGHQGQIGVAGDAQSIAKCSCARAHPHHG